MQYTVTKNIIEIIGKLWMGEVAAHRMEVDEWQVGNMRDDDGHITRESVRFWVDTHCGDFSEITDFAVDFGGGDNSVVIEWADQDNEFTFIDCMYPCED